MTYNANSGVSSEVEGPWLSPSEALTRFVPCEMEEAGDNRAITQVRFGARIGDIGMLVPQGMLSELVEDAKIYPLPTTPHWFRGLINLRGSLVPIFDLKALFDMQDQKVKTTKLLVLNSGEEAVGILIDDLPVTLEAIRRLEQLPKLPSVLREYSQEVYVRDEEVWVEFDFDGFFQAAGSLSVA